MRRIVLSIIALFAVLTVSAHAVFIETTLKGQKGILHVVKVVYGEPDEHEAIAHWWWYKEGAEVSLTLTKPDGSKEVLALTAKDNHLVGTFTPTVEGVYQVALQYNTDREPGAKSQYQINAATSIQVGKSTVGNTPENVANALHIYTTQDVLTKGKPVSLAVYEHGKPAVNTWFQVISPTGWSRWLETDDKGVAMFSPEWAGKYFAEGSKKEKVEGQVFEEYSRGVTYSFEVK